MRLPNVGRSTNTEFSKTVGPVLLSTSCSPSSEFSVIVNEVKLVKFLVIGAGALTKSVLVLCKQRKSSEKRLHVLERRGPGPSMVLLLPLS